MKKACFVQAFFMGLGFAALMAQKVPESPCWGGFAGVDRFNQVPWAISPVSA